MQKILFRLASLRLLISLTVLVGLMPAQFTRAETRAQSGGQHFWAVAVPFPTVADDISLKALQNFWQGNADALDGMTNNGTAPTLFTTDDGLAALKSILGDPSENAPIQVVAADDLVDAAWDQRPASFAVLPFDQLEARWKPLIVDGVNLFDKQADVSNYPLRTDGEANRNVDQMAVVAMTGVTALVRGTAVQMEKKGVLYPGAKIRDWLRTADIAHISNEVSFWDQCPRPTFNDGVTMCSNPKYMELLEDVGTDVIELTGNHLWDRGWQNLSTTLQMYDALGWPYFGGGASSATALDPAFFEVGGNKIAFVGCNWFGSDWATDTKPGSARCGAKNPRSLDLIVPLIQDLKAKGYLVIATLQYLEIYDYAASAQQVKDFAALRDAGAVVVNGSQGHHAQGFDVDANGFVHYGTGNLFFGDQAGVGTHQTFVDRHVFYNGRYLGVDLRTAYIQDYSQPVPMEPAARAKLLSTLFAASGY